MRIRGWIFLFNGFVCLLNWNRSRSVDVIYLIVEFIRSRNLFFFKGLEIFKLINLKCFIISMWFVFLFE